MCIAEMGRDHGPVANAEVDVPCGEVLARVVLAHIRRRGERDDFQRASGRTRASGTDPRPQRRSLQGASCEYRILVPDWYCAWGQVMPAPGAVMGC
jgi:hypothetical protein